MALEQQRCLEDYLPEWVKLRTPLEHRATVYAAAADGDTEVAAYLVGSVEAFFGTEAATLCSSVLRAMVQP